MTTLAVLLIAAGWLVAAGLAVLFVAGAVRVRDRQIPTDTPTAAERTPTMPAVDAAAPDQAAPAMPPWYAPLAELACDGDAPADLRRAASDACRDADRHTTLTAAVANLLRVGGNDLRAVMPHTVARVDDALDVTRGDQ